nr:hypothetical protein [Tanacetum cinerariifolium]
VKDKQEKNKIGTKLDENRKRGRAQQYSGYIENYNSYPYDSSRFPQQEHCCEDCEVLPEADHCQTPQYTVNHPIFNAHNDFLDSQNKITIAQNKIMKQMTSLTSMCEMACQIIQKKQEEKRIEEEQAANARYWKILACCDDDDDYDSAITPNEPADSLSMGDEHLNTNPAIESDEFIKSCVENLVPNPSKSEGENGCDSLSDEDFLEEIFSNPLIDSLLDEFTDELTLLKSIPSGIDKTDCYPKEEIRLTKRLLYDNSSPHPPKDDDDDSERDILILEELPSNYSLSLPVNESFYFDIPSFSRPPAKPPDVQVWVELGQAQRPKTSASWEAPHAYP